MPAAYQGSSTNPSNTNWQASHAYTAGHFVQPSTNTGQYFQAINNGTSGSSQPGWSTPSSLPVPGTTFVDGTVTWKCMGSIIANPLSTITIDEPVDTDPTVVAVIVRGLTNLANYISALLVTANNWLAEQIFQAGIVCSTSSASQAGIDSTGGPTAGSGGAFHGGTGGGDGVFATADTTGVGGFFTGGATGFGGTAGAGVVGVGGASGGVGGDFTGGAGGPAVGVGGHGVGAPGVFGNSDIGPGGQFNGNATAGPLRLSPLSSAPSSKNVGDFYVDNSTSPAHVFVCVTAGTWTMLI